MLVVQTLDVKKVHYMYYLLYHDFHSLSHHAACMVCGRITKHMFKVEWLCMINNHYSQIDKYLIQNDPSTNLRIYVNPCITLAQISMVWQGDQKMLFASYLHHEFLSNKVHWSHGMSNNHFKCISHMPSLAIFYHIRLKTA